VTAVTKAAVPERDYVRRREASNGWVNLSSSPIFTVLLLPVLAVGSIGLAQLLSVVFACAAWR